ncbi:sirohydrochlorin chelatase [Lysinibacillus sp. KU-BSD001]|uniref:sirohydrochlorin chelatase n=1 Tax=Lysinibacillus sp. KU-BSD001 TaxID=3141328 RepID=UPI0036E0F126
MKSILFVGHGSRLAAGNEEIQRFVDKIRPDLEDQFLVETCFLELSRPSIPEGIEACIQKGAKEVYVVPIILLHAGHSKLHIPAEIQDAIEKYPNVKFTYGETISVHPQVFDILIDRLQEVGIDTAAQHDDTAILLIGRGGSDAEANSDFYKITRLLWEKLQVKWVESAFMGVTKPRVDEGIKRCIQLGAKKVIMLPYFLFTGVLMERIDKMLQQYSEQYPKHEFVLAKYFGYHPTLQEILKQRAMDAVEGRSTGERDMEKYRAYVAEHGPIHRHCFDCHVRCHTPERCYNCPHAHDDHHHDHDHEHHHHSHAHDGKVEHTT